MNKNKIFITLTSRANSTKTQKSLMKRKEKGKYSRKVCAAKLLSLCLGIFDMEATERVASLGSDTPLMVNGNHGSFQHLHFDGLL